MEPTKLYILWTNDNLDTSQHMVFMYAINSMMKGWWDEVTVIIWGPTAKLVAENKRIQERMEVARHVGVKFSACVACARELGVESDLKKLGLDVIPWGPPLTELLQNGEKLITV